MQTSPPPKGARYVACPPVSPKKPRGAVLHTLSASLLRT